MQLAFMKHLHLVVERNDLQQFFPYLQSFNSKKKKKLRDTCVCVCAFVCAQARENV